MLMLLIVIVIIIIVVLATTKRQAYSVTSRVHDKDETACSKGSSDSIHEYSDMELKTSN